MIVCLCTLYPDMAISFQPAPTYFDKLSLVDVLQNNNKMLLLAFAFSVTFYSFLALRGKLLNSFLSSTIDKDVRFISLVLFYSFLLILLLTTAFKFIFPEPHTVKILNLHVLHTLNFVDSYTYSSYRNDFSNDIIHSYGPFFVLPNEQVTYQPIFSKFTFVIFINGILMWYLIFALILFSIFCIKKEPVK